MHAPPDGIRLADHASVTRINRRYQRGVTRFELTAVTAIGVAVTLAGALIIQPRMAAAEADEAVKDAGRIRVAVQEWRRENGSKGCPTLSQLLHEKQLSEKTRTDDPWGERYRVRCTDDEVTVVSPGQDGRPNTSDDIRVPRSSDTISNS